MDTRLVATFCRGCGWGRTSSREGSRCLQPATGLSQLRRAPTRVEPFVVDCAVGTAIRVVSPAAGLGLAALVARRLVVTVNVVGEGVTLGDT